LIPGRDYAANHTSRNRRYRPYTPNGSAVFQTCWQTLLTLLDASTETMPLQINEGRGSVARALTLLSSPRFVHRPAANTSEVIQRIAAMRDDWDASQ
jgi:hypothetical protein